MFIRWFLAGGNTITIGDIQAFIQYVRQFNQPIAQLAQTMNMLQSTAAAAERVFEFLEEEELEVETVKIETDEVEKFTWFSYFQSKLILVIFQKNNYS